MCILDMDRLPFVKIEPLALTLLKDGTSFLESSNSMRIITRHHLMNICPFTCTKIQRIVQTTNMYTVTCLFNKGSQVTHPWHPSCVGSAFIIAYGAFVNSCKVYSSLYLVIDRVNYTHTYKLTHICTFSSLEFLV